MHKKIMSLVLVIILTLSCIVLASAEKPMPTSLERPESLTVRDNGGILEVRWTNPKSIVQIANDANDRTFEYYANLVYVFDWKKNDGNWNIGLTRNDPNFNDEIHGYFTEWVPNGDVDGIRVQDCFFTTWHFDPNDDGEFDLKNNTYYFRLRYVLESGYDEFETIYSPYSDVFAIGKNANTAKITKLDAPKDLKVEVKKDNNNRPYFQLNWTIPESIVEANKHIPVYHKIDFKVGDGPWLKDTESWEWMPSAPSSLLMSSDTFDPVEKNLVDKVVIEENVYYFRIIFEAEPTTSNYIRSDFSNIASTKVESYSNASNWAKSELDKADDYGLIPSSLKGADMTKPITREEFAELAVKLYEKTTGKTIEPASPNPFTDTTNPEILKAYKVGITAGTSATTFSPKVLISREQLATMLSRGIRAMVPDADFSIDGAPTFNDEKDIAAYALEHVKFMSKNGIIQGSNGNFMPKAITQTQIAQGYAQATREQAIAMGVRSYEKFK
ncbi:S-layer domain protein [Proteiniborus sp. DW1]|uniref:S-layer homology domain-containing protein n=1 Tax=Proteiniborus sp. DW1 TaxID=1889883 RepID=UPI00092E1EEA|nr:S-layer homology domain-containing protein [Proteiniborus sp. DW1]SCG83974.1 S-layer domain protein [Proteiniborus sp. DW1]